MLCVVVLESNDAADKLFHDVLNRKDKADATRNTLAVLHRFKFLFNLPLTIERNIQKVSNERKCFVNMLYNVLLGL